ncbi:MAG: AAA family ATPase [Candidatus Sumerlaeia bacterium]
MKFTDIHIDGFGIYNDQHLDDLPPGLLIFHGPNESGKSSLLAYLRAMLFGFPKRVQNINTYEPLRGGNHGGRCGIITQNGHEYQIERNFSKARDHNQTIERGTGQAAPSLHDILGPISLEVYQNLYAFGLSELSALENLQGDDLRNAIYGAGQGDAFRALPKAIVELKKEMDGLFTKRGRTGPRINGLNNDLKDIRGQLLEAEKGLSRYEFLQRQKRETESQLRQISESLTADEKSLRKNETIENLWPKWENWQSLQKRLAEMDPELADFPIHLEPEMLEHEREHAGKTDLEADIKEDRAALEAQIEQTHIDRDLLDAATDLSRLKAEASRFQQALESIPVKRREIENQRERTAAMLRKLGPGWDIDQARSLDRSLFTTGAIEDFREKLARGQMEIENAESNHTEKKDAFERSQSEELVLQAKCSEAPRNVETLSEIQDNLRELIRLRQEKQGVEGESRHLQERIEDKASRVESLPVPAQPSPFLLVLGIILLIAGTTGIGLGLYQYQYVSPDLTIEWIMAAAGGAFLLPAGLISIMVSIFRGRAHRQSLERHRQQRIPLEQEIEKLREEQADLINAGKKLEARILEISTALEIDAGMPVSDLEKEQQDCAEEMIRLRELLRDREKAHAKAELDGSAFEAARERLEAAHARHQMNAREWQSWLEKSGLPGGIMPARASEAMQIVNDAIDLARDTDNLENQTNREEQWKREYLRNAEAFFRIIKRDMPPETALELTLGEIDDALRQNRDSLARLEEKRSQLEKIEVNLSKNRHHLQRIESRINTILNKAKTPDIHAFKLRAQQCHAYRETREELENLEETLCFGLTADNMQSVRLLLENTSLSEAQQTREARRHNIGALQEKDNALRTELAEIKQESKTLAGSDAIARLRLREESILEEISGAARLYRRNAIALHLLQAARHKFEEEKQPGVIKYAGEIFQTITQNGYSRIVAPIGEDFFSVYNQAGKNLTPDQLSRGTAEQLYLALRFGFIRQRAENLEPLPVIMDDILVNFDPDRSHQTARAIQNLARDHQIFFFTCQDQMVETLKEENPGAKIYRIEDGAISESTQLIE